MFESNLEMQSVVGKRITSNGAYCLIWSNKRVPTQDCFFCKIFKKMGQGHGPNGLPTLGPVTEKGVVNRVLK